MAHPSLGSRLTTRLRSRARWRAWWPLVVLAGLVIVAVSANRGGGYVPDNRFEQYLHPWRMLTHQLSLWDSRRGLGGIREDWWPGAVIPVGLIRLVVVDPALAERIWHGALIFAAGCGAMVLLRCLGRRDPVAMLAVGVLFAFNPVVATYLVPSNLFLHYALAPWLAVAMIRGTRDGRVWGGAAAFALLVWLAGDTNLPALLYAVAPGAALVGYVWLVDGSVSGHAVRRWLLRAVGLSAAVSLVALLKLAIGADVLSQRVALTETPRAVSATSSWSESWRGLGFWLAYFVDRSGPTRLQLRTYIEVWPVVLATFMVPSLALVAAARSEWRARYALVFVMVASVVVMVGGFGPGLRAPVGTGVLAAFERVGALAGFRSTYKVAVGLTLATSLLLGPEAVGWVRSMWRAGTGVRAVAVAAALLAVATLSSATFWRGELYRGEAGQATVPGYWHRAAAWLNRQPGHGRVLVLPASTTTTYRWGTPGDDILDALLDRGHPVATTIPRTGRQAANLLNAVSHRISDGVYSPGMLAQIAPRLGVDYVLLRNDLDWRENDDIRPAGLSTLRSDPSLHAVAAFGNPGQNVVDPSDASSAASAELHLRPVEIFRLGPKTATPSGSPPVLLSGDGAAWADLAADGSLAALGPIRYAGDTNADEMAQLLRSGSAVVVTDTNRRRTTVARSTSSVSSQTLAAGELAPGSLSSLFGRSSAQSVTEFGDASRMSASSVGTPIAGYQPWLRAANAFDDDPRTSWLAAGLEKAEGSWVRATLKRSRRVAHVVVRTPDTVGGRRAVRATLILSGGFSRPLDLRTGRADVTFRARATRFIEVRLDRVSGRGLGPVGLTDVHVDGLDLRERVRVPDDLRPASVTHRALSPLLARAPTRFHFALTARDGEPAEERDLRRRFWSAGARAFQGTAAVALPPDVDDRVVDEVVGGDVGAYGSDRAGPALSGRGGLAVDGRIDTGWVAPPRLGTTLTVRFPSRTVDHVEVVAPHASSFFSALRRVSVTVGKQVREADLKPVSSCLGSNPAKPCTDTAFIPFLPDQVDHVTVTVRGVAGTKPLQVLEVFTTFTGNPAAPDLNAIGACLGGLLTIDGKPVTLKPSGTAAGLLSGSATTLTTCRDVPLGPGWHNLDASVGVDLSRLDLVAGSMSPGRTGPVVRLLGGASNGSTTGRLPGGAQWLLSGQSFDPGWRATAGGHDLGRPRALDTQAGWLLPAAPRADARITFRPETWVRVGGVVSVAAVLLCLLLAWPRRRDPGYAVAPAAVVPQAPPTQRVAILRMAACVVVAWLVAGPAGGLAALVAVAVRVTRPTRLLVAALLVLVAGVLTIVPTKELTQRPGFAADHRLAAQAGAAAVGVVLSAFVELAPRREPELTEAP